MIKFLPDTVDGLNLDRILLYIHNFMKVLPRERQSQQHDMPHRTLNTVVHQLCCLAGPTVSTHTAQELTLCLFWALSFHATAFV